jgi:hypothetical protein
LANFRALATIFKFLGGNFGNKKKLESKFQKKCQNFQKIWPNFQTHKIEKKRKP